MRGYTLLAQRPLNRGIKGAVATYRFEIVPPVSRRGGRSIIAASAYQNGEKLRDYPRSAVEAATYQSGERLHDERAQATHDYRRRGGVLHTDILAPENAPPWAYDREKLWNIVDKAEKRKDSQLARPLIISLPHELTREQNIALLTGFVRKEFVERGMIADLAVHAPDRKGDLRNVHAHILLTMRDIGPEGFGLKRRDWNQRKLALHWRKAWADHANSALEAAGSTERIDHRSLKDRGIEREPEPKMGPVATEMERLGKNSHVGGERQAVKQRNERRKELPAEGAMLDKVIAELRWDILMSDDPVARETTRQADAVTAETERQAQAGKDQQAALDRAGREWQAAEDDRRAAIIEARALRHRDYAVQQTGEMERAEFEEKREAADRFQTAKLDNIVTAEQGSQLDAARAETDINEPHTRYAIALSRNYSMANPYESLAKSAMAEYGMFMEQRERLTHAIAATADPEAQQRLRIRREIEGLEYLAITGERIAKQSELITGRDNTPEAVRMRARVSGEVLTEGKVAALFEKHGMQRMGPDEIKTFVESVTEQQKTQGGGWAQRATALRVEYRERTQGRPASGPSVAPVPVAPTADMSVAPGKTEPWMRQAGGYDKLGAAHKQSAENSYARWTAAKPELGEKHDLRDYVAYVQREHAAAPAGPQRPSNRVDLSKISDADRKRIRDTDSKLLNQQERSIQRRMIVAENAAAPRPTPGRDRER
jgi:MobA/MobL family